MFTDLRLTGICVGSLCSGGVEGVEGFGLVSETGGVGKPIRFDEPTGVSWEAFIWNVTEPNIYVLPRRFPDASVHPQRS